MEKVFGGLAMGRDNSVNNSESLVPAVNKLRSDHDELRGEHMDLKQKFEKAFPAGDFEGHRRYHEVMIQILDEKRKLRMAIQEKTIGGLVWSALFGLGLLLWHELQRLLVLAKG